MHGMRPVTDLSSSHCLYD